jgi:hypothetical protein
MKKINVDRSIVCFGNRFLQGKEEAQKLRLTKLLKSLKLSRRKLWWTSKRGDGVDVSTKMEQAQLA